MQSLWNSTESERWNSNDLEARVYSARLLGGEPDFGCGVGGAGSVKITEKDLFGEPAELLYIQAAGTKLANVEFAQFVPLRRDHLLRLLRLPRISTRDLEQQIRLASKYPVFGPSILLIPYFPSNFDLAKAVAVALQNRHNEKPTGLVLAKRGLCTFGETAEESYRRMLYLVSTAEERIQKSLRPARVTRTANASGAVVRTGLAQLRRQISELTGRPMILSTRSALM